MSQSEIASVQDNIFVRNVLPIGFGYCSSATEANSIRYFIYIYIYVVKEFHLLQGAWVGRCLSQGSFTSATKRDDWKVFVIREFHICEKDWGNRRCLLSGRLTSVTMRGGMEGV